MEKKHTWAVPGLAAGLLLLLQQSPLFAQGLVSDDLITGSSFTTPWQVCTTDSLAVDVTLLDAGGCAYRETPAEPGNVYRMSCGVFPAKFSSITLAFLDENDVTLATETTNISDDVAGLYSVTLQAPLNTATAAIGIYGEEGSGFQDCVLVDTTPTPEPTKGSISGVTWLDENADSILDSSEVRISGTTVSLIINGEIFEQTITNADGEYTFGDLDVGACYIISFTAADSTLQLGATGGDNDADASGATAPVCLSDSAPDVADVDAPFVPVPPVVPPADNVICGFAWADMNGNGVFDSNDSTLSNVRVKLFDANGNRLDHVDTNESGAYAFDSLVDGDYRIMFNTPDGYEPTIASGMPAAGTSFIDANGNTALFNVPSDSNTADDSACTIDSVNGGFFKLPIALDPTVANDDSVIFNVGTDFTIDILSNDEACDGVDNVDLLGHNVPGEVVYNFATGMFVVSNTTDFGNYSISYGLRGACGSYDTATVFVELLEVVPPPPPAAPEAPVCRVETRGSITYGGVDVFHPQEFGFAPEYNLYDREKNLVITVSSTDFTHKYLIGNNANQNESPWIGSYEIEWNGTAYGYDQVSIYYAAALENNIESSLTECIRTFISPIALDLDNNGRIPRVTGEFQVDLNGDGTQESLLEWFAPSAGILVNAAASGKISGEHMFGNVPGLYEDGFAELATLDANKDGKLSGEELSDLAIWNDRNSDTIVDKGELSSLTDHDIVSLALTHYKYMARATKAGGKSILMEDVWLPQSNATISQK